VERFVVGARIGSVAVRDGDGRVWIVECEKVVPVLEQKVDDLLIRAGHIFHGRIPTSQPNGKTLEELFWTGGGHGSDEILLFHGTDSSSRRELQARGVKVDVAKIIAFGQGFYLTPDPREAITYAETRFRQRHPTVSCMSPVLVVYRIRRDDMRRWTFPDDFNMKWSSPYYVIIKNQKMTADLEHVATYFLEERCRRPAPR